MDSYGNSNILSGSDCTLFCSISMAIDASFLYPLAFLYGHCTRHLSFTVLVHLAPYQFVIISRRCGREFSCLWISSVWIKNPSNYYSLLIYLFVLFLRGWNQRATVSIFFGLGMSAVAYYVDRWMDCTDDFAFWLYLFGLLTFWSGLTTQVYLNEPVTVQAISRLTTILNKNSPVPMKQVVCYISA